MSFPRYPKYKASGVEWLGEVPAHWEVTRMRALANDVPGSFTDGDWIEAPFITDEGVRLLQTGNIGVGAYKEQGFRFISEQSFETLACTEVDPGDILVCRLAEPVGRACLAPHLGMRMITSVDVCILKPRATVHPQFVVYLMCSAQYLGFMEGQCRGGTRDRVSRSFLAGVRLSLPPLPEQRAIAAFLDRETAKIDALIAEQEKLIELLAEKRQAVISHAVTKGLNPDAPMKPSGVEWLGDVPAHWEVRRLGVLFREVNEQGEEDMPILSVSIHDGISDKEIAAEEMDRKVTRSDDRTKYKRVAKGDLVYNMMRAWQGGFGTVAVEGMVSPAYVVARPRSKILTSYVECVLRTPAAVEQMRRCSRGITDFRLRLYWDEFKNISMPVPPFAEVEGICAAICGMAEQAAALEVEAQSAITLLRERRAALISAAVTGQIDVRHLDSEPVA